MREFECNCEPVACLKIDFDTEGAFCPDCQGFVIPIGEGKIEEEIWKSELVKSYIEQLSNYAGEGFDLSMNRLGESISALAHILAELRKLMEQILL
jgi:hypothetical protein